MLTRPLVPQATGFARHPSAETWPRNLVRVWALAFAAIYLYWAVLWGLPPGMIG